MSIDWSEIQRTAVEGALSRYPAESHECREAARLLLPIARERDAGARAWRLRPREGRYIVPMRSVGRDWFFHVTVETEAHCVDALTGVAGTPRAAYAGEQVLQLLRDQTTDARSRSADEPA